MCTQENQMNRINLILCLPFAAGYHHYSGLRNKLFARLAPCMLGKKGGCVAFDWMRQGILTLRSTGVSVNPCNHRPAGCSRRSSSATKSLFTEPRKKKEKKGTFKPPIKCLSVLFIIEKYERPLKGQGSLRVVNCL